jgi:hypothetical protein
MTVLAILPESRPCPFPRLGTEKDPCQYRAEYMEGDGTWRCPAHGTLLCPWPRQYPA